VVELINLDDRYDEGLDWDITDDDRFEERAREWAEENADALVTDFTEYGLADKAIQAHNDAWPRVQAILQTADARSSTGNNDEAVFHLARALEGYVRAVYLDPIVSQLLDTLSSRQSAALVRNSDLLPNQLRDTGRLLMFSLIGFTTDVNEADDIRKMIMKAVNGGVWRATRNRVVHSLYHPERTEVVSLAIVVNDALSRAAGPLLKRIREQEEAAEKIRTSNADRLEDLPNFESWAEGRPFVPPPTDK
jgi:hypothetical protein